ncbi:MAG: single-stranded DNA-binding protein, partial [Clostridiales bacterium]|nr:single-stranded DNA-binding protein [Clostridiales bacterium]
VCLSGFLCKPPVYRKSPMGREICDLLLAVNRMYGKSDYIPCIAWGRNAAYTANLAVGTPLRTEGRIQSRTYIKKQESGLSEERTAYEVSLLKIEE